MAGVRCAVIAAPPPVVPLEIHRPNPSLASASPPPPAAAAAAAVVAAAVVDRPPAVGAAGLWMTPDRDRALVFQNGSSRLLSA